VNEAELRGYLKSRFRQYRDTLTLDDDLREVVDSLALFDLVLFIEETTGARVPTDAFTPSRFASMRAILEFSEELRPKS
jgi:acyl carrier protein